MESADSRLFVFKKNTESFSAEFLKQRKYASLTDAYLFESFDVLSSVIISIYSKVTKNEYK